MTVQLHGGDIYSFAQAYGKKPLDFSANVNPLGMSPLARDAACLALTFAHAYPDLACRELRKALGAHRGISQDYVVCGNGASDLIYRLVSVVAPQTALLVVPGFSEYEAALNESASEIRYHYLPQETLVLDESVLIDISPEVDLMFLCQPNNPSGILSEPGLVDAIIKRCEETETLLVIDECFRDFVSASKQPSYVSVLERKSHVIVIDAFTKVYGMAGLRLGYLMTSNEDILHRVQRAGQPWAVSGIAQAAGVAALDDVAYLQKSLKLICEQREKMKAELQSLKMKVFPSEANFLLFQSDVPNLADELAEYGVLIRDCSNYRGLGQGYFRVAVKTESENNILLTALKEIVSAGDIG